jgi:hypothetical protein
MTLDQKTFLATSAPASAERRIVQTGKSLEIEGIIRPLMLGLNLPRDRQQAHRQFPSFISFYRQFIYFTFCSAIGRRLESSLRKIDNKAR